MSDVRVRELERLAATGDRVAVERHYAMLLRSGQVPSFTARFTRLVKLSLAGELPWFRIPRSLHGSLQEFLPGGYYRSKEYSSDPFQFARRFVLLLTTNSEAEIRTLATAEELVKHTLNTVVDRVAWSPGLAADLMLWEGVEISLSAAASSAGFPLAGETRPLVPEWDDEFFEWHQEELS